MKSPRRFAATPFFKGGKNPSRQQRGALLHFLVIGGLLFAAQPLWSPRDAPLPPREPVRIAPAEVAHLRAAWPGEKQFQAALDSRIREEVLLREALRLGIDRRDPVVRERLLANMRFAFPQQLGSGETLLAEARRLGMVERDVVVRRRLAQVMELRLARAAADTPVPAQVSLPTKPRYALSHVFFRAERAQRDADARRALAELVAGRSVAGADAFLLGAEFRSLTHEQIARRFGQEFAAAVTAAPRGEWAGPYASPFGVHLVRIENLAPAAADPETVRVQSAYAQQHAQRQQVARQAIAALRASYRVELP